MVRQSAKAPVGHNWHPIEDWPEDWETLADADLRQLADHWDENREELDSGVRSRNSTSG